MNGNMAGKVITGALLAACVLVFYVSGYFINTN